MKKIMTVVLALAVIFGFSACSDGSTISYYGDKVLSVTLASAPEYIVGQTLNPADVTLRVVYDQGTETTFKASELGMKPAEGKTFKLEADNTFTVNYGRMESSNTEVSRPWDIKIKAVTLTTLTVDPSDAATTIVKGDDLDTAGVVYTAELANGKEVIVSESVAHEIAAFELDADTSAASTGDTITVSASGTDESKISIEPVWTLTVTEEDTEYTDYIVAQDTSVEVFGFEQVGASVKNKLSDVEFTLKGVIDGVEVPLTIGSAAGEYSVEISDTYTDIVLDKSYTVQVTVTLNGNGSNVEDEIVATKPVTVKPTEDYVTEFKVDYNRVYGTDKDEPYTFAAGEKITTDRFTFTASEWASGHTYADDEASKNSLKYGEFTVTPGRVDYGWDEATFDVSFEYKLNADATASSDSITNVNVNVE